MDAVYRLLSEFLAGLLLFGGAGWLVDHFFHTAVGVPIGLAVGLALAGYATYLRRSKGDRPMFPQSEGAHQRAEKGDTQ